MIEPADIFHPRHYVGVRKPFGAAGTLPGWCYTSEQFYERELERIFMRHWNCIGRVDRIPNPGDYVALEFARVGIVVVRDKAGVVRAFSNSCRHRGSAVADGHGNCDFLQCPYHHWTYALDGTLIGTPLVQENAHFKKKDYGLVPIRLETWAGLMFINFDPNGIGLMEYLGDLPAKCKVYNPEEMVLARHAEYQINANWKIYFEGSMEGYHVFALHRTTLAKHTVARRDIFTGDDVQGEYIALFAEHQGTRGVMPGAKKFPEIEGVDRGTWFNAIFPATTVNFTVDSMIMSQLYPLGVDRTLLVREVCVPKSTALEASFEEVAAIYARDTEAVLLEDIWMAERQHRGLRSPLTVPGWYATPEGPSGTEECVHVIDRWILDRVLDPA